MLLSDIGEVADDRLRLTAIVQMEKYCSVIWSTQSEVKQS